MTDPCPVPGCILTGPHEKHVTATGARFTRTVGHTSIGPPDLAARLLAAGVRAPSLPAPLPDGLVVVDDPHEVIPPRHGKSVLTGMFGEPPDPLPIGPLGLPVLDRRHGDN